MVKDPIEARVSAHQSWTHPSRDYCWGITLQATPRGSPKLGCGQDRGQPPKPFFINLDFEAHVPLESPERMKPFGPSQRQATTLEGYKSIRRLPPCLRRARLRLSAKPGSMCRRRHMALTRAVACGSRKVTRKSQVTKLPL